MVTKANKQSQHNLHSSAKTSRLSVFHTWHPVNECPRIFTLIELINRYYVWLCVHSITCATTFVSAVRRACLEIALSCWPELFGNNLMICCCPVEKNVISVFFFSFIKKILRFLQARIEQSRVDDIQIVSNFWFERGQKRHLTRNEFAVCCVQNWSCVRDILIQRIKTKCQANYMVDSCCSNGMQCQCSDDGNAYDENDRHKKKYENDTMFCWNVCASIPNRNHPWNTEYEKCVVINEKIAS